MFENDSKEAQSIGEETDNPVAVFPTCCHFIMDTSSENGFHDEPLVEPGLSLPRENEHPPQTLMQKFVLCSGSILVFLFCNCVFSILLLVIGAVNYSRCPINPNIPTWLIIIGSYTIVRGVIDVTVKVCCSETTHWALRKFSGLPDFLITIYFIWGSVWIYMVYSHVSFDTAMGSRFCDPWAYWSGFIAVTAAYVALLGAIVLLCCICCLAVLFVDTRE